MTRSRLRGPVVVRNGVGLVSALVLVGCGSAAAPDGSTTATSASSTSSAQQFPDVTSARLTSTGDATYSLEVTMSSPYDTPDRYADGWRVLDPAGQVLGEMTLDHDHASEQPFTRTQTGLEIPAGVATVTVQGRDLANGYGGGTVDVEVP